jgi:hypothetical protein
VMTVEIVATFREIQSGERSEGMQYCSDKLDIIALNPRKAIGQSQYPINY